MENIALDRIPHKKIREFIQAQIDNNVTSVQDLKPSYQYGEFLGDLNRHEESFEAGFNINQVWEFYSRTGPNTVFRNKLVSFSLMLSKQNEKEILYKEEPFLSTQVGQVYFMNLNVFKGLIQLAVSYEIMEINNEERFFEFSYIKGGKSIGMQRIELHSLGNNRTQIKHITHYKSDSKLRDKYIYPYFHSMVLQEYHQNLIEYMSRKLAH